VSRFARVWQLLPLKFFQGCPPTPGRLGPFAETVLRSALRGSIASGQHTSPTEGCWERRGRAALPVEAILEALAWSRHKSAPHSVSLPWAAALLQGRESAMGWAALNRDYGFRMRTAELLCCVGHLPDGCTSDDPFAQPRAYRHV
jgi:hypothetical protein